MAKMLGALLQLQLVERQLAHVRGRLKSRQNAVAAQQHRIDQLQEEHKALLERATNRRMSADRHELDLKTREQQVLRLRGTLNTVKTNKEYSAILTQINTLKADNAKIEEEALKIIQEVITLGVFVGFAWVVLGEKLKWNYAVSLVCLALAVYFAFGFNRPPAPTA